MNVNEIVLLMKMGQSRISRHLKILTDCEILTSRRDGLMIFYSLSRETMGRKVIDSIKDFFDKDKELKLDIEQLEKSIEERSREKVRYLPVFMVVTLTAWSIVSIAPAISLSFEFIFQIVNHFI